MRFKDEIPIVKYNLSTFVFLWNTIDYANVIILEHYKIIQVCIISSVPHMDTIAEIGIYKGVIQWQQCFIIKAFSCF